MRLERRSDPNGATTSNNPSPTAAPAVQESGEPFQVQLAGTWDRKTDLTGWWISEKFDGARAYWDGKNFVSRQGNVFEAPEWFKEGLPSYPLDGELWLGFGRVAEGNGILNSKDPRKADRWKEMRFLVFDAPSLDKPFEERVAFIEKHHAEGRHPYTRPVQHVKAESNAQVMELLARVKAHEGEGLVARAPGSHYENRRSAQMLKIKTFFDAEAVVVGYKMPDKKNYYGPAAVRAVELGASGIRSLRARILVGTLPGDDQEKALESAISVGAVKLGAEFGITMQGKLRKKPPKPGTIVTFKYMELTPENKAPRHPTWIGVREDYSGPPLPSVQEIIKAKKSA
jgi:DNA ligase-1